MRERIGSLSQWSCFAAGIAKWILQLWPPNDFLAIVMKILRGNGYAQNCWMGRDKSKKGCHPVCQANGSEADQPTLPLALPSSAVHLVVDDASLTLLEGVLRERRGGIWYDMVQLLF